MKLVEFELNGQTHHLLLTGAALFEMYDQFGDKGDLLGRITGASGESYRNTVWMLVQLARHGELYRRYMGDSHLPMLSVEAAQNTMRPVDVLRARTAIREAFAVGFASDKASETQEIDLGLLELQKKTGLGSAAQNGSAGRPSFWGSLLRRA